MAETNNAPTLEQLIDKVTKLSDKVDQQQKVVDEQTKLIENQQIVADQQAGLIQNQQSVIERLKKENAAFKAAITTVVALGSGSKAENMLRERPKKPTDVVSVGDRKFKFRVASFTLKNGQTVTALDAINDQQLLAKLVETGSGVLMEVFE